MKITPIDKSQFFSRLLETLRAECLHAIEASKDAADYATNEESKAVSQWDTQGLEASYLAAGQASQARQWAEVVKELQSEREVLLKPNSDISPGALFYCDMGGELEWFFFAGVAGGQVIQTELGFKFFSVNISLWAYQCNSSRLLVAELLPLRMPN